MRNNVVVLAWYLILSFSVFLSLFPMRSEFSRLEYQIWHVSVAELTLMTKSEGGRGDWEEEDWFRVRSIPDTLLRNIHSPFLRFCLLTNCNLTYHHTSQYAPKGIPPHSYRAFSPCNAMPCPSCLAFPCLMPLLKPIITTPNPAQEPPAPISSVRTQRPSLQQPLPASRLQTSLLPPQSPRPSHPRQ